ncbi:MAG: potassium channel family protein, partial [Acidimicrobiia bacterium]|nr:potassium channel family protein [Acidimicrobiia bacterium]
LLAVVGRVVHHERVETQTLLGALAAYFLIGLFFAWIYLALDGFVDGPVLQPPVEGVPSYYSMVVLTTLGFGDINPVDQLARKVTAIEAITGQIFLATLVARLVSLYGRPRAPG